MAEQGEIDKYIKCSKCRCKYINDDENIKTDFGLNRLNERFKTCVKCRTKHKQYCDKRLSEDVGQDFKRCARCHNVHSLSYYGEYDGVVVIDTKCYPQRMQHKWCAECRDKDKDRDRS